MNDKDEREIIRQVNRRFAFERRSLAPGDTVEIDGVTKTISHRVTRWPRVVIVFTDGSEVYSDEIASE